MGRKIPFIHSRPLLPSEVKFREFLEKYLAEDEKAEQMDARHQAITNGYAHCIVHKPAEKSSKQFE